MGKMVDEILYFILERILCLSNGKSKTINPPEIKRILAIGGGGGIGDLLLALPALESLNYNFPHAKISLLASNICSEALLLFPNKNIISDVIEYDPKGRHKGFFKKLFLILSLRKRHYDLAYFPSRGEGMRKEVLMNFIIGATHRLGFIKGKVGSLNTIKVELRDDVPIIKQNLDILAAANLKMRYSEKTLEVQEKYLTEANEFLMLHTHNNTFPIISIHPGALWYSENKCWPIEKYVQLIKSIIDEFGAKVVVVGSKEETLISETLNKNIKSPFILNMIGKTTVVQTAAFIKQSHLFIGNDSGPFHIANFLNVPTIVLFGATSPRQIVSSVNNCTIVSKNLNCSPCYLHYPGLMPGCKDARCLKEIEVEEVMNAVRKEIKRQAGHD